MLNLVMLNFSPVIYWTDGFVYGLLFVFGSWGFLTRHAPQMQTLKNKILSRPRYLASVIILAFFGLVGLLDTLHFTTETLKPKVMSVLDVIMSPVGQNNEETYSAPFATRSFVPEFVKNESGQLLEIYPKLEYAGTHLQGNQFKQNKSLDILTRVWKGMFQGILVTLLFYMLFRRKISRMFSGVLQSGKSVTINTASPESTSAVSASPETASPETASPETAYMKTLSLKSISLSASVWITLGILSCFVCVCLNLMQEYHILGTDKVGRDVFYMAIKSIRTGLVIGILTTLVMLPFALILGMWAGYFSGIIDDLIQYVYITLSSIPAVLLIAAAVLSFQLKIEGNPDLKLLLLCLILGITSWTSLCRLLRGESLVLRDSEFVQAAITLGVSHFTIIRRHIFPNLMHIVIITLVLDFSGLVLSEAVLTYVGVGVDASTYSFGNMINAARLEMVRDPMVWWSLVGSFTLMFALVFSANIFSEAVQQAMNPRNE